MINKFIFLVVKAAYLLLPNLAETKDLCVLSINLHLSIFVR